MPRQLLRDGRVVADDWTYLADVGDAADARVEAAAHGLILTFGQWLAGQADWRAAAGRLGVILSPTDRVEQLAPDLARFDLVGAHFPGPSDGRGYTQGRLLRERFGFTGELRATGYVRRDQLFFLARCGFNSFELAPGEIQAAGDAFATFSARYQPSNDAGLRRELQHR